MLIQSCPHFAPRLLFKSSRYSSSSLIAIPHFNPLADCYFAAMNLPAYRQAIANYIRTHANPPDKLSHQPRLYHLAKQLAGGQPFDDDVLYAAAWLHDLGVFIGHRPEDPAELAKW